MVKKYLTLLLFIFVAACSPATPTFLPTPAADQISREEQAVYAFLLAKWYQHTGYVIMADTATGSTGVEDTARTLDYVLQNLHGMDPGTLDSFRSRNITAQVLPADMQIGGPYTLLSQTVRSQIFSQNQSGWDIFYSHYPQAPGITTFSRVGFDGGLNQALVYMGTQSNWLVGAGYYFLLRKANGAWSIDQQVMVWKS